MKGSCVSQYPISVRKELFMADKNSTSVKTDHRLTVRLHPEDYDRLVYWAKHEGLSVNEFIPEMLDLFIAIRNGDYALPTLEAARLNQLIDLITTLSQNVALLESTCNAGFDSLIDLTRGGSSYLDDSGYAPGGDR